MVPSVVVGEGVGVRSGKAFGEAAEEGATVAVTLDLAVGVCSADVQAAVRRKPRAIANCQYRADAMRAL